MTNMSFHTFLVRTKASPDTPDELDVRAETEAEAWALARAEADDLYGVDSTLELIEAGGSGGLFTWLSA